MDPIEVSYSDGLMAVLVPCMTSSINTADPALLQPQKPHPPMPLTNQLQVRVILFYVSSYIEKGVF